MLSHHGLTAITWKLWWGQAKKTPKHSSHDHLTLELWNLTTPKCKECRLHISMSICCQSNLWLWIFRIWTNIHNYWVIKCYCRHCNMQPTSCSTYVLPSISLLALYSGPVIMWTFWYFFVRSLQWVSNLFQNPPLLSISCGTIFVR